MPILTCCILVLSHWVLRRPERKEALLRSIEPDAGLLEAVKVSQGKGLVS